MLSAREKATKLGCLRLKASTDKRALNTTKLSREKKKKENKKSPEKNEATFAIRVRARTLYLQKKTRQERAQKAAIVLSLLSIYYLLCQRGWAEVLSLSLSFTRHSVGVAEHANYPHQIRRYILIPACSCSFRAVPCLPCAARPFKFTLPRRALLLYFFAYIILICATARAFVCMLLPLHPLCFYIYTPICPTGLN